MHREIDTNSKFKILWHYKQQTLELQILLEQQHTAIRCHSKSRKHFLKCLLLLISLLLLALPNLLKLPKDGDIAIDQFTSFDELRLSDLVFFEYLVSKGPAVMCLG